MSARDDACSGPSNRGIPFFFLRVDKAGNVSKRFNASSIQLARYGGTCPRLDVHYCFRVPGRILTQRVEMPDGAEFITINRTVSRPASRFNQEDRRQAVSVGCAIQHAPDTGLWRRQHLWPARDSDGDRGELPAVSREPCATSAPTSPLSGRCRSQSPGAGKIGLRTDLPRLIFVSWTGSTGRAKRWR